MELLTPDPKPTYGQGATRPEPTRIRYRRRATPLALPEDAVAAVAQ